MAKRIDSLTDAQKARIPEWVDKWVEKGLCTEPADRETFESGAERCYGFADIPWHGRVVWVTSPFLVSQAGPCAAYILEDGEPDTDQSFDIKDDLRRAVQEATGRDDVDAHIVGAFKSGYVRRHCHQYIGGNLWVSWQALTSFFRDVCELELDGDLWDRDRAYADAQVSAGQWWPHSDFIVVSDRPTVIVREQIGPPGWGSHRLHCETGPAIAWRGGEELFFWHGTNVPEWVITGPNAELISKESNTEVRRCAIEAYGWDRYLDEIGVEPVSEEEDPGNPGHTLRLYDLPDESQLYDERVRLVVMENASRDRDGTRRTFAETVPANIESAVAAQAWAFSVDEDVYRQIERAT